MTRRTSLEKLLGRELDYAEVQDKVCAKFGEVFEIDLAAKRIEDVAPVKQFVYAIVTHTLRS